MGQSGIRSGLYKVSEWISKFSLTNLQWVLFNLPVAFVLLSVLYSQNTGDLFILMPLLAVLIPTVFFPATTAMFAKAREWVRTDQEDQPERSYVSYYKENYKVSLLAGLLFTLLWGILVADIYYFSTTNQLLMNLFLIIGILLFVFTINFFSVTVHFNMKLKGLLKQAFLMTVISPILFVTVVITSGLILYISLYIFQLMFVIFTGSIISFLSFSAFYRLYLKLNPAEPKT